MFQKINFLKHEKLVLVFHARSTLVWNITYTDDAVMELLVPNFHEAYQTGIPSLQSESCCVINPIVYCIPSTQLYECITTNCLLQLKVTTCFNPLCGHHQVNTGTYMCILNCKCLPHIWAHIYN
jgi:hypothetical protein